MINGPNYEKIVEKFLIDSISKAENYLKINNIDLKYSGSTVHLLIIIKKTLFILNLGNSWSVLYRQIEEDKYAIELSEDHIPSNKDEWYWIYQNGGIVERLTVDGHKQGPLRIWNKRIENGPGLQITRSLGDSVAKSLGVIN